MGLCKCPKKKVTTQFCFEHRVNVCEHCLVANHPKVSVLLRCMFHSCVLNIEMNISLASVLQKGVKCK